MRSDQTSPHIVGATGGYSHDESYYLTFVKGLWLSVKRSSEAKMENRKQNPKGQHAKSRKFVHSNPLLLTLEK